MKKRTGGKLKSCISAFPEWKAQLLSTDHDTIVMDKPWRVLTEKALGCMKGFMPTEIISKIESGERSIFNHNDADAIPKAILHLTVDLAVNQLIQTLFFWQIQFDTGSNFSFQRLSENMVTLLVSLQSPSYIFKELFDLLDYLTLLFDFF